MKQFTMRTVKGLLLITASFLFQPNSGLLADAADDSASTPNIVFLFADDQCTYSVGCYGNKDVQTPNMDQLARDGLVFDRHYNTTAICMASRASVFTGMYEYKTGCNFGHGDMHADVWAKSYPVLLREAGYVTAFAGKFGIVVEGKGLCEDDFDVWGGGPGQTNYETAKNQSMQKYAVEYPHSTLSYGAFAQDVIREAAKLKRPFCLSISFKAPHKPATPDPRFNDVYAGRTFTKPANFGREFGEHLSLQSKQGRQYPRFTEWHYDTDYDGEMAKYHQQVYGIDVALGVIRDELKVQGVADNTVVIYTSDNGYICGSHGYGSKVLPMEESSRVPLIIYDPRSPLNGKQIRCDPLELYSVYSGSYGGMGKKENPSAIPATGLWEQRWSTPTPFAGHAIVASENTVMAAGVPMLKGYSVEDTNASYAGEKGGIAWLLDATDGHKLQELRFDAAPVWDGIAIAHDHYFISLKDGSVVCLADKYRER
jgi:arylsulfatase A-like enzyme